MRVAVLSDIHGNLTALQKTVSSLDDIGALILLGDLIDYGPRSNEAVRLISSLPYNVLCNIRGNHEQAILTGDYTRFSSERGVESAKYTKSILDDAAMTYISQMMTASGTCEFTAGGRRCLAVHGCLGDEYWGKIVPGCSDEAYREYDVVFSGHTHKPHVFETFYKTDDPSRRNMKKTMFINPGSVGQPRNLCPFAQYAVWDTDAGTVELKRVSYDVEYEQGFFTDNVDVFYKTRLKEGI